MFGSEGFQCNPQLHSSAAVNGNKLVMLQLDYIAVFFGNYICHAG